MNHYFVISRSGVRSPREAPFSQQISGRIFPDPLIPAISWSSDPCKTFAVPRPAGERGGAA